VDVRIKPSSRSDKEMAENEKGMKRKRYHEYIIKSRPPKRFRSVDFPLPELPMIDTNFPSSISSDTSVSACTTLSPVPYVFVRWNEKEEES